jgi:hypothetical protein
LAASPHTSSSAGGANTSATTTDSSSTCRCAGGTPSAYTGHAACACAGSPGAGSTPTSGVGLSHLPPQRIERHRYVTIPDAEKAANADHHGLNLALAVDQHIVDVTDVLVPVIVDIHPLQL